EGGGDGGRGDELQMAAASMLQGHSSSHRARIEGSGACLLSDFQLACCLCMPPKSELVRLSYLTTPRTAASSPPSVSGYIRRCRGPSSVARSRPDRPAPRCSPARRSDRIGRRLLQWMSPLLAQSGHPGTSAICPVSGVKRTCRDGRRLIVTTRSEHHPHSAWR